MLARSVLLLRRDWHAMTREWESTPTSTTAPNTTAPNTAQPWGITNITPSENFLEWTANIEALPGSLFEGGVFQVGVMINPPQ